VPPSAQTRGRLRLSVRPPVWLSTCPTCCPPRHPCAAPLPQPAPPKCFQQEVAVFGVRSRSKANSLKPLAYRSTAKSIRKHIASTRCAGEVRPRYRQKAFYFSYPPVTFSASGDTSGCVFNATVHWGDGVITNVSHIVDGQTMTHTYDAPGLYTVHITGAGTPTGPDATCTFNPHTVVTVQTHAQGIR
jgi:hypothetical protein